MWAIAHQNPTVLPAVRAKPLVRKELYVKPPFDPTAGGRSRGPPKRKLPANVVAAASSEFESNKRRGEHKFENGNPVGDDEYEAMGIEESQTVSQKVLDNVLKQDEQKRMQDEFGIDLSAVSAAYQPEKDQENFCLELESTVFNELMNDVEALHEAYTREVEQDLRMKTGMSYEESISADVNQTNRLVRGDLILREFISNFAHFRITKFAPQLDVIRSATAALLPQMFGDTWPENRERVLERYRFPNCKKELIISMPRRSGKSQVSGMIEASALRSIGGKSAIFAPFMFQATELAKIVHMFFLQLPGGEAMVVRKNQKSMKVSRTGNKDETSEVGGAGEMFIFSGGANAARGFTAKRIYFDEASFAKDEFMTTNVFAGMLLADVFVMLISSPPDSSNSIFNQLCTIKNAAGEFIFHHIAVENMCEACQLARQIRCPHKILAIPPWQSGSEERGNIETVLGAIDPRRYRIEILGVSEGTDIDAFPKPLIDNFIKQPEMHFDRPPRFIGIGIDPSGEGESETGIAAAAMDDEGNFVVSQ